MLLRKKSDFLSSADKLGESDMKTAMPINGCKTTKISCRPGCALGDRTKTENRVYFDSREEARERGYRPCKVCKPDEPICETSLLTEYNSPLGVYVIASSQWAIVLLKNQERAKIFIDRWERRNVSIKHTDTHHLELKKQLDAYFDGQCIKFTVHLDLRGTPSQRKMWHALRKIPWG
jgi:hypothetical protein